MKTLQWLRNSKGEFEQVGSMPDKVRYVHIECLSEAGIWKEIGNHEYPAKQAFDIIVSAIAKKQTGKHHGFRLVPSVSQSNKEPKARKPSAMEEAVPIKPLTEKQRLHKWDKELRPNAVKKILENEPTKQEEVEMAKQQKEVPKDKILGYFRRGTAMAAFVEPLLDEKVHKLSAVFTAAKKAGADPEFRLTVFRQKCGEMDLGGVVVDRDADTIQFKKGKGNPLPKSAKKVTASAPAAQAKKAKNGNSTTSDVAVLVRKLLKNGSDWTKNKLVEKIHADHSIEPKRIHAAIAAEINGKGIVEEKGKLSLSAN